MSKLREIDDAFVDEYIITHRTRLSKPVIGGTDWRFADIVAPAFREVLEIAQPESILEIGFCIGGSALMFLSINPKLTYHSVDIVDKEKSGNYLHSRFPGWDLYLADSRKIEPMEDGFNKWYDMVFVDGDHSDEGVRDDIQTALEFGPRYILLDDYKHPSHSIEKIVTEEYADRLEVVKVFEFNQCWQGYSMALCKRKNL